MGRDVKEKVCEGVREEVNHRDAPASNKQVKEADAVFTNVKDYVYLG